MSSQVIIALISVISVILGTILGGLITYLSNRDIKNREWQLAVLREDINDRKKLYAEFLSEASKLILASLQMKTNDLGRFDHLSSLVAQIEFLGSDKVIQASKSLADNVFTCHAEGRH